MINCRNIGTRKRPCVKYICKRRGFLPTLLSVQLTKLSLAACDVSGVDRIDLIPFKGERVRETIKKDGEFRLRPFNSMCLGICFPRFVCAKNGRLVPKSITRMLLAQVYYFLQLLRAIRKYNKHVNISVCFTKSM